LLIFDPAFSPDTEIRGIALAEYSKSHLVPQGTSPATPTRDQMESSSILKRKRSVDSFLHKPTTDENNKAPSNKSPARFSTSVKNGLSKIGVSRKVDPDLYEIVKKFRLEPKKLQKKKQYQILYFPVAAPLSENERKQKKQVTSIKIL